MASEAQVQRERKGGLRSVRREQRTVDSKLEVWEREVARLLKKKRLVDLEDGRRLVQMYNDFFAAEQKWESAIQNFLKILT